MTTVFLFPRPLSFSPRFRRQFLPLLLGRCRRSLYLLHPSWSQLQLRAILSLARPLEYSWTRLQALTIGCTQFVFILRDEISWVCVQFISERLSITKAVVQRARHASMLLHLRELQKCQDRIVVDTFGDSVVLERSELSALLHLAQLHASPWGQLYTRGLLISDATCSQLCSQTRIMANSTSQVRHLEAQPTSRTHHSCHWYFATGTRIGLGVIGFSHDRHSCSYLLEQCVHL